MTTVTRIDLIGGVLALVRTASTGADAERLAREARLLERLDHPGTVQLLAWRRTPTGGTELTTALAPRGSLADRGGERFSSAELARITAAVAHTLSAAHAVGIAHGALDARRILLDGDRRPLVCGWGAEGDPPPGPADDVAALGRLVGHLLDEAHAGAETPVLRAIVARATVADDSARPTMAAIAETAGSAPRRPRGDDGRVTDRPGERDPRTRIAGDVRPALVRAAALAGIVATAVALVTTARPGPLPADPAPGDQPAGAELAVPAPPSPPAADPGQQPAPAPGGGPGPMPSSPAPGPDCLPVPDGGCAGPVVVDGHAVSAGRHHWVLGDAGDVAAVGRWQCRTVPTPAVVRPSTGEVWVYPRWATGDEGVAGELVATRPGAVAVVAERGGRPGCDELAVVDRDGRSERLTAG